MPTNRTVPKREETLVAKKQRQSIPLQSEFRRHFALDEYLAKLSAHQNEAHVDQSTLELVVSKI